MEGCSNFPDGNFSDIVGRSLREFAEELRQAYESFLAQHLRLASHISTLQAQLQMSQADHCQSSHRAIPDRIYLALPDDGVSDAVLVHQPPPTAPLGPFLSKLAETDPKHQQESERQCDGSAMSDHADERPESDDIDPVLSKVSSTMEFNETCSVPPEPTRQEDAGWLTLRMNDETRIQRQGSPHDTECSRRSEAIFHRRVHARLGHLRDKGFVAGPDLHETLGELGLEKFTVREINNLINTVGRAINLKVWEGDERPSKKRPSSPRSRRSRTTQELLEADWRWPDLMHTETGGHHRRRRNSGQRIISHLSSFSTGSGQGTQQEQTDMVLPWAAFLELLFKEETFLEKLLGRTLTDQVFAIKEVLFTGEANRLISELTFVRIDDLATRRRRLEPKVVLDIAVSAMILLNGLVVGLETDLAPPGWAARSWVQIVFATFFVVEILVRQWLDGFVMYFCGPERSWNVFDTLLAVAGAGEVIAQSQGLPAESAVVVIRFIRVARLSRWVRVFRLSFMLDLRLMIKGLLSGVRTLFWAFILLAFVLYGLGVSAASVFKDTPDEAIQELFADVPISMFTAFRCVTGDCFTRGGSSLTCALYKAYGVPFAVCFMAIWILITLGLFNVILAIYVDTIMVAAKQTEDANKGRHEFECIRIAHITKRLLKIFCVAYRAYCNLPFTEREQLSLRQIMLSAKSLDEDIDDDINISKDLYLRVIQEPEVQKLMDDLDIPPDRASLFDSIDADGSGRLQATELVQGFLKVRGEVKVDHIACLLCLRSIQGTLKEMTDRMEEQKQTLTALKKDQKGALRDQLSTTFQAKNT